jgi:glycosyltransferase involved in cell wall biosynthesis
MKTCIIIPCYNEALRIKVSEYISFINEHDDIDFCFANDGSTDTTIEILNDLSIELPKRVTVLNFDVNRGKAEAVRFAILELYSKKSYDYIGYFDADLSTPLSEIIFFLEIFKEKPDLLMVMGSRVKRMGAIVERKFSRFFSGRIFATIISSQILKVPVYDTQCGAKVFSTKIEVSIFENPFLTRWIFDVEILLRLKNKYGKSVFDLIVEFPLNSWIEMGDSKIKFLDFLKVPIDIFRLHKTK